VIHVCVLAGELAKFCEGWEHEAAKDDAGGSEIDVCSKRDEIAPWIADLLMHASQLANITHGNLLSSLTDRMSDNAHRFSVNSRFKELASNPKNEFLLDK
jgi:hypothetical protein